MSDETVEIPMDDLRYLYETLADATSAAQMGDPNECSRLAAEAKRHVEDLHEEHA